MECCCFFLNNLWLSLTFSFFLSHSRWTNLGCTSFTVKTNRCPTIYLLSMVARFSRWVGYSSLHYDYDCLYITIVVLTCVIEWGEYKERFATYSNESRTRIVLRTKNHTRPSDGHTEIKSLYTNFYRRQCLFIICDCCHTFCELHCVVSEVTFEMDLCTMVVCRSLCRIFKHHTITACQSQRTS